MRLKQLMIPFNPQNVPIIDVHEYNLQGFHYFYFSPISINAEISLLVFSVKTTASSIVNPSLNMT